MLQRKAMDEDSFSGMIPGLCCITDGQGHAAGGWQPGGYLAGDYLFRMLRSHQADICVNMLT